MKQWYLGTLMLCLCHADGANCRLQRALGPGTLEHLLLSTTRGLVTVLGWEEISRGGQLAFDVRKKQAGEEWSAGWSALLSTQGGREILPGGHGLRHLFLHSHSHCPVTVLAKKSSLYQMCEDSCLIANFLLTFNDLSSVGSHSSTSLLKYNSFCRS